MHELRAWQMFWGFVCHDFGELGKHLGFSIQVGDLDRLEKEKMGFKEVLRSLEGEDMR